MLTPSPSQLSRLWTLASCCPDELDRRYYMARMLYDDLGLDWRNADHASHVERLVVEVAGPQEKVKTWARVNG